MTLILFKSCLSLFMILVVVCCTESGGKEALIVDRLNSWFVQLPNRISKKANCDAWATACPAPENAIAGSNLMKNALIVKEIYETHRKATEVEMNICEESFKVALAFNIITLNFRFGYAVYFNLKNEGYFHRSDFKDFITPEQITEVMRKHSVVKKKYFLDERSKRMNDELWFYDNQRMEFMWINLFSLRFDFSHKTVKKIVYTIHRYSKWPIKERCVDYSLGSEVYDQTGVNYIDNLYLQDNQNQIFENIKIPQRPCDPESGICPMKSPCESKKLCLSKWLLLPMDQFNFGSSTSRACSNLATVPIWTDKVEKVLRKVDQYLFALYRIIRGTFIITSGISDDVLELPLAKAKKWGKKYSKIYLDLAKEKIPVPKIIYKIVKYRFLVDSKPKVLSDWYSAMIVIHNDPYYDGSRICYEDITTEWGWEEITKDSNNVYVCISDGDTYRKLVGRNAAVELSRSFHLNLKDFPPFIKGERNLNIKKAVDEEFNRLSKIGDDPNLRDEVMRQDKESEDEDDDDEVKIEREKEE